MADERTPPIGRALSALSRRTETVARRLIPGWATPLIVGVVVMLGIFIPIYNALQPAKYCGDENSGCALSRSAERFLGRVFTRDGAPAAGATVRYDFPSLQTRAVAVSTDHEGRYCLRWGAVESQGPFFDSVVIRGAGGPPDPRYIGLARKAHGPLIVSPSDGPGAG